MPTQAMSLQGPWPSNHGNPVLRDTNTTTNTTTRWHFGELGVVSESTGVAANLPDGRLRLPQASIRCGLSSSSLKLEVGWTGGYTR